MLGGQKGTVWYQVYGTKIPFRVWSIQVFKLKKSTKEPGKTERDYRFKENDMVHHEAAVKIVRAWLKELKGITALK